MLVLFHVRMDVRIPPELDLDSRSELLAAERAYSRELQRIGKWVGIWRIVGQYANFSVFDVESNDELHQLLSDLPLFQYLDIQVTPLARHPSAINQ